MSLFLFIIPFKDPMNELTIMDNDVTIATIDREDYMFDFIETPFVNDKKLMELAKKINDEIYEQPMNARIDNHGKIIEGQAGLMLDQLEFYRLFYQYFYEKHPTKFTVPKINIYPRVNSELLSIIKEKKLGNYVTHYKESNLERSHNIHLSTEAINNHVVFPGEKFSFNEVVGERTEEKGYKKAPVIVKGEFSEDIGGGICQVSSTLYNAVDLEGIEIVERYSHSRSVPYVPPGKDATVSWWGPDFVFQNHYNQPILIRAFAKNGVLSIELYSAEDVSY